MCHVLPFSCARAADLTHEESVIPSRSAAAMNSNFSKMDTQMRISSSRTVTLCFLAFLEVVVFCFLNMTTFLRRRAYKVKNYFSGSGDAVASGGVDGLGVASGWIGVS